MRQMNQRIHEGVANCKPLGIQIFQPGILQMDQAIQSDIGAGNEKSLQVPQPSNVSQAFVGNAG